jgi:hypothetical protein
MPDFLFKRYIRFPSEFVSVISAPVFSIDPPKNRIGPIDDAQRGKIILGILGAMFGRC